MTQLPQPRLFGTDGMRGRADEFPLDPKTLFRLGRVLGGILSATSGDTSSGASPKALLGGDTRESSPRIATQLAAGLQEAGVRVTYAGVITTPGIAHLTRHGNFQAGVMVSASHNPYADNGVKIFSPQGMKIPDSLEEEIEEKLRNQKAGPPKASPSTLDPETELLVSYVDHLAQLIPAGVEVSRLRLVADCANGAASRLAPLVTEKLGLDCTFLNNDPDGENINRDCGSLHPEKMARVVSEQGADLGVAFDGDADRAIFSTGKGRITHGDGILWVAARFLKSQGGLAENRVVGTVMTNYGLELALEREGIRLARTPVGDKYVLEEMLRSGANLGGEPSGHLIFSDLSTAGDGLVSLLMTLRIMAESGRSLEDLVGELKLLPHVIQNILVKSQPPLESVEPIQQALARSEERLQGRGRILVRYSGTEPLLRVMVEANDEEVVREITDDIVRVIRKHLA